MPLLSPAPISQIPPLGKSKDANPEDVLWRLLMKAIYGLAVEDLWSKWCRFAALAGQGSDNWPLMAAAVWLWSSSARVIEGFDARGWWRQFFRWQLGIDKDAPGDIIYFCMSEIWSNTYDGMNVGSVLAVRLWAIRNNDAELLDLTGRWLTVWCASLALASGPPPRKILSHTPGKVSEIKLPKQGINLPSLVQIGGRSTPLHYIDDPRTMLFAEMIRWPNASHPWPKRDAWEFWFLQISSMCGDDFIDGHVADSALRRAVEGSLDACDYLVARLSGVRFKGNFEVWRWDDGTVLGIMPEVINGNTGAVLASVILPDGTCEHLYPWEGAKPKDMGSGRARVEAGAVWAESSYGKCGPVSLPAGEPARKWIFGPEGFKVEIGPQTPTTKPQEPQVTPPNPPVIPPRARTVEEILADHEDRIARLERGER